MPFPSTPVLSSFAGANEDPLSEGGAWAKPDSANHGLQLISNAVSATAAATDRAYWTGSSFVVNSEAYCTLTTVPALDTAAGVDVRLKDVGGTNTLDGYTAWFNNAAVDEIIFYRRDNNVPTQLGATVTSAAWATNGNKIGISAQDTTITAWWFNGTVWAAGGTRTDATYTSGGFIGLAGNNTTFRADDFGGGTTIPDVIPFIPHRMPLAV